MSTYTKKNLSNVQINYTVNDGQRPWMNDRPITANDFHQTKFGGETDTHFCTIKDGRDEQIDLDTHSFALCQQTTSLSTDDFYPSRSKITSDYYDEMSDLIAKQTGAAEVVVFSHGVRNEQNSEAQGYARGVHVDYTMASSYDLLPMAYKLLEKKGRDPKQFQQGRFMVINAWRNTSTTPIEQDSLAVCDARSIVYPDDFIAADFHNRINMLEQYRVSGRNAGRHQWYYFPAMSKDEVLLIKQFDSNVDCEARQCFHTSFFDPTAPVDAAPRQSCEVRAVAFPPSDTPDAFGSVRTEVEKAALGLLNSLDQSFYWPQPLKHAVLNLPAGEVGTDLLFDMLAKGPDSELESASEEVMTAIRAKAIEYHYYKHAAVARRKIAIAAEKRDESKETKSDE